MNTMIKTSAGWSVSKVLIVAAFALTLTACGGGGSSSSSSSSTSTLDQVKALVASGTAANLETAMNLVNDTCDNVSAAQCEALMDAIAVA
jgi:hypothetical protein